MTWPAWVPPDLRKILEHGLVVAGAIITFGTVARISYCFLDHNLYTEWIETTENILLVVLVTGLAIETGMDFLKKVWDNVPKLWVFIA